MRIGENVVYRYGNTVRVGRWVQTTGNHRAIIQTFHKGNESFIKRNLNQIYSLGDLVDKYGLGTPKRYPRKENPEWGHR